MNGLSRRSAGFLALVMIGNLIMIAPATERCAPSAMREGWK